MYNRLDAIAPVKAFLGPVAPETMQKPVKVRTLPGDYCTSDKVGGRGRVLRLMNDKGSVVAVVAWDGGRRSIEDVSTLYRG